MISKDQEKNGLLHVKKIDTIVPCWLDAGTALHVYRDQTVHNDLDIDIGIFPESVPLIMDNWKDFNVIRVKVGGRNNVVRVIQCLSGEENSIQIDINIFYETENYRILFGHTWYIWIPKYFFDSFGRIKWGDKYFFLPGNIEEFLEHRYGSNWKIEVSRETWLKSIPRINTKDHERPAMRINHEVEDLMHNMGITLYGK